VHAALNTFDFSLALLQKVFLGAALIVGVMCAVDWAVRTRRVNAFSPLARFSRRFMRPIIAPVEKSVVRAGGNPVNAPWWALIAIVVAGIITLSLLGFIRAETGNFYLALNSGPRGVIRLALSWTFAAFYIALLVRVISSWFQLNPYRGVVRLSHIVTEPVLSPIRRIIPSVGIIDISPIVAYLALSWIVEPLLLRLV
jgi:YggT family protein